MSIINLQQSDKFRSWLNKINEIIDTLNKTVNDVLGKSPTIHSSPNTMYGAGDSTNYGHVMLSDSTNNTSNSTKGVAATPLAVKDAYDKAQSALTLAESNKSTTNSNSELITQIQTDLANKAPTKHSSNQTTYGIGTNIDYGHVKLTTDLTLDDDSSSGVAVAPLAVKIINDNLVSLSNVVDGKASTNHKSNSVIYGVGNETEYGHVKLSDDVTLEGSIDDGIAATIGSVKRTYDLADKADLNSTDALLQLQQKAPTNHASAEITYGIGDTEVYGHVKVTDSLNLDSNAINGIVPSAGALRETYLKASEAYDLASSLQNSGSTGTGGTATTKLLTTEDLNLVLENGVYLSNNSSQSLNYPYTDACISVLEVSKVGSNSDYIKQRLYSNNALYVRDSFDAGAGWEDWILVAKNKTNEPINIYISVKHGNDGNVGVTPDAPISSIEKLIDLINIQSIVGSTDKGNQNIKVFFDKGTYYTNTVQNPETQETITEIVPIVLADIPMAIQLTSYDYETTKDEIVEDGEGEGVTDTETETEGEGVTDTETEGEEIVLDKDRPHLIEVNILNSNVSLCGLKIDSLYVQENSTVIIESYDYMSLGHIEANTGSTIYISSLQASNEDEFVPLFIHNTNPEDSIFCAFDYGLIYDTRDRVIQFDESVEKSYLFECSFHGNIDLSTITFYSEPSTTITMTQYSVSSYGSLIHPEVLIGDPTNNVVEENTYLQGVLWGDGSNTKYLRADGTWQTPPDTNTTYTASDGIKLTGTNFTNTGVTSFNGETGDITVAQPIIYVKTFYDGVDGTSWYRSWDNGWLEQWGRATSTGLDEMTVDFHKNYTRTSPNIYIEPNSIEIDDWWNAEIRVISKSKTGFTVKSVNKQTGEGINLSFDWYAFGV